MRTSVLAKLQEKQLNIPSSSSVDKKESAISKLPTPWGLPIERKESAKAKHSSAKSSNVVDKHITFHLFTRESYKRLLIRDAEMKKKAEERALRSQEARLIDGELKFGADVDDKIPAPNPDLQENSALKEEYGKPPAKYLGLPLEEIDKGIMTKTFIVLSKRFRRINISRFSASRAFYIFSPWNPVRRVAVYIATNQYFDSFILLTILVNCVCLALTSLNEVDTLENTFFVIYSVEVVIKLLAKGMILDQYTYLRDPWNWLDLIIVLIGIPSVFTSNNADANSTNTQVFRSLRVLRVLKTVSFFQGLRTFVNAMLRAFKMLCEVILLTFFCLMVLAVFSVDTFSGSMRQKCVRDPATLEKPPNMIYAEFYKEVIRNKSYWGLDESGDFQLCGNSTGARKCGPNYICLPDIGDNPDYGYTNFDSFGYGMLLCFQVTTLDFWENTFRKVLVTNGMWAVVYFVVTVFVGSFYLLNLMLAVVTISYEEEAERTDKEIAAEKEMSSKKRKDILYDLTIMSVLNKKYGEPEATKVDDDPPASKMKVKETIMHWRTKVSKTSSVQSPWNTDSMVLPSSINRIKQLMEAKKYANIWSSHMSAKRIDSPVQVDAKDITSEKETGTTLTVPTEHASVSQPNVTDRSPFLRPDIIERSSFLRPDDQKGTSQKLNVRELFLSKSQNCSTPFYSTKDTTNMNNHKVREGSLPTQQADHLIIEDFQVDQSWTAIALVAGHSSRHKDVVGNRGHNMFTNNTYNESVVTPSNLKTISNPFEGPKQEASIAVASGLPVEIERKDCLSDSEKDQSDNRQLHTDSPELATESAITTKTGAESLCAVLGGFSDFVSDGRTRSDFIVQKLHSEVVKRLNSSFWQCDESRENITEENDWKVNASENQEEILAGNLEKVGKLSGKYVIGVYEDDCDAVETQEELKNEKSRSECTCNDDCTEDCTNKNLNALTPLNYNDTAHANVAGQLEGIGLYIPISPQEPSENKNVSAFDQHSKKTLFGSEPNIASAHLQRPSMAKKDSFMLEMEPAPTDSTCCSHCLYNVRMKWFYFRQMIRNITSSREFDLFINFAIVVNTIFVSLEHHGMSQDMKEVLRKANLIFTGLFVIEAALKLMGMGFRRYFQGAWNRFDIVIAIIGLVYVTADRMTDEKVSYLLIMRPVRLLRILKLARVWPAMSNLLTVIVNAMVAVGHLTIILIIILYMFAVIGLQLFYKNYTPYRFGGEVPRWNFIDFPHSFMMVFRILCGEWVEALWDCMRVNTNEALCLAVFFPTLLLGNFVVLNLFLALLLNAFGKENANKEKLAKHIEHTPASSSTWDIFVGKMKCVCCKCKRKPEDDVQVTVHSPARQRKAPALQGDHFPIQPEKFEKQVLSVSTTTANVTLLKVETEDKADDLIPCWPSFIQWCCTCEVELWNRCRRCAIVIVHSNAFNAFIFFLILSSSIELVFEDYYLSEKAVLKSTLEDLNLAFTIFFILEMLLHWIAKGFVHYFTNIWSVIDFIAAVASVFSTIVETTFRDDDTAESLDAFHAFRALRALRPLRAISRFEGMRIVVNALVRAIPEIINVYLVSMVFWLIFSAMGVQFFSGMFYKCVDKDGKKLTYEQVYTRALCEEKGYQWINAKINFDNVLNGFLALFQVATFEGWMEVMEDAIDSTEVDVQPKFENRMLIYLYFIAFIICGSFLSLNLVIGVIIDNFNVLKKKYEGSLMDAFLTPHQRNYYKTLKLLANRQPEKSITRPRFYIQQFFYDMSVSRSFEMFLMTVAFLNLCAMAMEEYRMPCMTEIAVNILNIAFITFFTLEAVIKIIGLRRSYFTDMWCLFNFCVAVLSTLSLSGYIIKAYKVHTYQWLHSIFVSPTILRVLRIARIGRVMRLFKVAKGINKLILALVISLPAILNILALLMLCMFVYAVVGMLLFDNLKLNGAFTELTNFRTFWNSLMMLLTLATAAGWNDILESMFEIPNCNETHYINSKGRAVVASSGDCGTRWIATAYMVSYIIITYLIIINMYIAIILENYDQAHSQEEVGVTEDDLDMYYSVWKRYDPKATQFIEHSQLSDFVADLDKPLGIDKPNEIALVSFNVPIMAGNKLHCLDILLALVKNVLAHMEDSNDMAPLREKMSSKFAAIFPNRDKIPQISTTLQRKKEDVAVRTLQKAWIGFKTKQAMKTLMVLAMRENIRRTSSLSANPSTRSVSDLCVNLTIALHKFFQNLLSTAEEKGQVQSTASLHSLTARLSQPTLEFDTTLKESSVDNKQVDIYLRPKVTMLTSKLLQSSTRRKKKVERSDSSSESANV